MSAYQRQNEPSRSRTIEAAGTGKIPLFQALTLDC
jgi:hypothetical protein